MKVDRVWGGTKVSYGTVSDKDYIYAAYYDYDRWLTVSQINRCTGDIKRVHLPSRFVGWDAHNAVELALDSAGRLHVAGNMHVSPLVYARMESVDDLNSLAMLRPMVNLEEDRATYPNFFRFPDGSLGFSYRAGHSGDGREIINRFDGAGWTRWIDQPLFASSVAKQTVNAYHTGFVPGPDGTMHIAWVWREEGGVENNFHINYAKSRDLRTWQNSKGESIALPITPSNAEVVDSVERERGLLNNIRLGFDNHGYVVISYIKFDNQGYSQLFHARREPKGWDRVQSTNWTYRWDPRGGGTLPSEISFSGVQVRGGKLLELVRQPEIGSVTFTYAPETLQIESVLVDYEWEFVPKVRREVNPGAVINVRTVRNTSSASEKIYVISWLSHPADTRDRPRECRPAGLPCDFISDLMLHTRYSTSGVEH